MPAGIRFVCLCGWLLVVLAAPARAQWLPTGPISAAGGRVAIGVEASAGMAAPEDDSYFNYTSDSYNLLRLFRLDASARWDISSQVALLGDVRLDGAIDGGGWRIRPFAAFARLRPWPGRPLTVQAGIIPPVFGAFSRRGYGADNPLIGVPLAYQYLTSLRPDALPASADDLLERHGHGWMVFYPVGSSEGDHGVPLIDGLSYPAGVEVFASTGQLEASAAITSGSLSESSGRERAVGPNLSARVAIRPVASLTLGLSGSRSGFVTGSLADGVGLDRGEAGGQRALAFDAEFSRGYWLVRGEIVRSAWTIPEVGAPFLDGPLSSVGAHVEARYRVLPGLYVAARAERLTFSRISGSAGRLPWEAPVSRFEVGGGYALARNLLLKASYQHNERDTTYAPTAGYASAQLLVWF